MVMAPRAISLSTSMRRASRNVIRIDPLYLPCVNYYGQSEQMAKNILSVLSNCGGGALTLLVEHLTGVKKYVIIIDKYSGLYNRPSIPCDLTCNIFEKGKQEVFVRPRYFIYQREVMPWHHQGRSMPWE